MKNIQIEAERCRQLEKALANRKFNEAAAQVGARAATLEWALAQLNPPAAAKPAPEPAKKGK